MINVAFYLNRAGRTNADASPSVTVRRQRLMALQNVMHHTTNLFWGKQ